MADIDITITHRDADGVALVLSAANGYTVVGGGLTEGARGFRREVAVSPFLPGRVLVAAVADVRSGRLALRVTGATWAQVASRLAVLRAAFEQLVYTLEVDIEGVLEVWACEPADSAVGDAGTFDEVGAMNLRQDITFTFPYSQIGA